MELLDKQFKFARLLPLLINKAHELGFEVTGGEWLRTEEQSRWNAKKGSGIVHSLHRIKLAIDLNLFKDRKVLIHTEDYKELGEYWEGLTGEGYRCVWGGRFIKRPDGGHFSIEHGGYQ